MSNSVSSAKRHAVILPYFCEDEVDRYLRIADTIAKFPQPKVTCDFVLAASPKTQISERLVRAYENLGETVAFQCPTQVFGYPEGPTAMFWDCMDFLSARYPGEDGFGLWLESDMAPIKPDWIDRLSAEWYEDADQTENVQTPIMMGCYVPDIYKAKLFQQPKLMLDNHINGGACYAMDFAKEMPAEAREGVFDMAVYQYAKDLGRTKPTRQITFSTNKRVRRDLSDPAKVLLHGFMQEKDEFIANCLNPLTPFEQKAAILNPALNQLETIQRKFKLQIAPHSRKTILENVLLTKQQFEAKEDSQSRPLRRAA